MKVINEHFRIQSKDLRHLSVNLMAKVMITSMQIESLVKLLRVYGGCLGVKSR